MNREHLLTHLVNEEELYTSYKALITKQLETLREEELLLVKMLETNDPVTSTHFSNQNFTTSLDDLFPENLIHDDLDIDIAQILAGDSYTPLTPPLSDDDIDIDFDFLE